MITLDSCAAQEPLCGGHAFLRASDSGLRGAAVHAAHAELAAQRDSWQVSYHCFRMRHTSLICLQGADVLRSAPVAVTFDGECRDSPPPRALY